MTASRKFSHDKDFNFFHKKAFIKKKNCITNKKRYNSNLYINMNELVYERRLVKVFSMTKLLC